MIRTKGEKQMISPVITARPLGEDITYFPPETQHLTVSVICE